MQGPRHGEEIKDFCRESFGISKVHSSSRLPDVLRRASVNIIRLVAVSVASSRRKRPKDRESDRPSEPGAVSLCTRLCESAAP